ARGRARALVAQLLTGDEVMLVAAAERAHVVLAWTADHTRAHDRLEALEPLDTPTNLAAALELALGERRARPETQVAVLTDLPREASGVARAELDSLDWVQIGRSDDNVAITGLSVDAPPFRPVGDATATVLVRNYAHVELRPRRAARAAARRAGALPGAAGRQPGLPWQAPGRRRGRHRLGRGPPRRRGARRPRGADPRARRSARHAGLGERGRARRD